MGKTTVKLNHAGFRALLKSPELESGLKGLADGIAQRAGEGYASDTYQAGSRVIASAYTDSFDAMRRSAKSGGTELTEAMQG